MGKENTCSAGPEFESPEPTWKPCAPIFTLASSLPAPLLLSCHMYFLTLSFRPLPALFMVYHDDHKRVYMEASLWMLIWNPSVTCPGIVQLDHMVVFFFFRFFFKDL